MIEVLKQTLEALEDVGVLTDREWQAVHKNKANELRQAIAELESQEPVPTIENLEQEIYQNTRNFVSLDVMQWMLKRYYTHPPQRKCENCGEFGTCCLKTESQERNFCSRCGKRTNYIHTCTPPRENT